MSLILRSAVTCARKFPRSLKMSATELRDRALQRQARARLEARSAMIVGLVLSVFFAWTFTRAHAALTRMGWGLLSLWGIYAAYHAYRWIWPRNLPEDAPISTCVEFYLRALERRRDHLRHRWRGLGCPSCYWGSRRSRALSSIRSQASLNTRVLENTLLIFRATL
jgi:hypothetical protein